MYFTHIYLRQFSKSNLIGLNTIIKYFNILFTIFINNHEAIINYIPTTDQT